MNIWHIFTHTHTYTYTNTHTHTHIHTHTHTHTSAIVAQKHPIIGYFPALRGTRCKQNAKLPTFCRCPQAQVLSICVISAAIRT